MLLHRHYVNLTAVINRGDKFAIYFVKPNDIICESGTNGLFRDLWLSRSAEQKKD